MSIFASVSFVRALIDVDSNVLDVLFKMGECDFDIDDLIKGQMPALHFAVIFRRPDIVKVLLKYGADVNVTNQIGCTCLHYAIWTVIKGGSACQIRKIFEDVVLDDELKQKLSEPFSMEEKNQQNVQKLFSSGDDDRELLGFRLEYPNLVDNIALIELLLQSGADPNIQSHDGVTPFMHQCSVYQQDMRVMDLFLEHGADVTAPIDVDNCESMPEITAKYGSAEILERLLDAGAHMNDSSILDRALITTFYNGCRPDKDVISIMKLLVERGACIDAVVRRLNTPLQSAILNDSVVGLKYLLKLGADPNLFHKNSSSCVSQLPLILSLDSVSVELAQYLLDYGANPFYKNSNGSTLLNTAVKKEDVCRAEGEDDDSPLPLKYVTLLMEHGVTIGQCDYDDLTSEQIELLEQCQQELEVLKKTKIHPDYCTTYFNFLLKRDTALVPCLRNKDIVDTMKSEEYKNRFPNFAHRLKANCKRGLRQVNMADQILSALRDVFVDIFPNELILMISDYFNLEDLDNCFGNDFSLTCYF